MRSRFPYVLLALPLPLPLLGCDGSTSPSDKIALILVSAVGDTLRGVSRTYQFAAFAFDDAGERIEDVTFSWRSSNEEVVQVDQTGLAQTLATGSAAINAQAGGVTGEAVVFVSDQAGMVAAGKGPACAIDEDGHAHCWGIWGGIPQEKLVPELLTDDLVFHSVTAGWDFHVCGLTTDGDAYCWGHNSNGVLGDGTVGVSRPEPTPVAGAIPFRFLRSSGNHTCAIAFSGDTYCWGGNQNGQLGTTATEQCSFGPCSTAPVRVETDLRFRYLSLTSFLSCGLTEEGAMHCWGQDASSTPIVATPTAVDTDVRFEYVAGAHSQQCGLGLDGVTYCWWLWIQRTSPTPIGGPDLEFVGETAGGHFCGLDAEGRAYCWGANGLGQLGNGTFQDSYDVAVPVAGDLRFSSITAGDQYTCGMTFDSEVYCWGMGALGIGTREGDGVAGCPGGNQCWTTPKRTLFNP